MRLRAAWFLLLSPIMLWADPASHVVLIVWDGMRPDLIGPETTPALWRFAQEGVFFQNHHSVFLSSTEVNGTALGTGAYPEHSGVMANTEYWPAINPLRPIAIEAPASIHRGDAVTHGHYLKIATVAEILRAQSPPLSTAIAGAKPVAWLLDRAEHTDATAPVVAEGLTRPPEMAARLSDKFGSFPPIHITKVDRDRWTTDVLLDDFWSAGVPSYSVLWLSEPDWSQHEKGPASPEAMNGIRSSDTNFGRVIAALRTKGMLEQTDIMVVSDHGVSTIDRKIDLAADLSRAGFATSRALSPTAAPDTILVVGNGGSATLYVLDHSRAVIRRVVAFLERQDYTGVLFTKDGEDGTFPLALAKIDTPRAPDIVVAFRWTAARNPYGVAGAIESEAGSARGPGEGMHGSLSPFDQHNTLVAAGPHFRRGIHDPLPSGNVDVAPTILSLLGVKPPAAMDGRVLTEALTIDGPKVRSFDVTRHEASNRIDDSVWRQYLVVSQVNGVSYFDEGNGSRTAAAPPPEFKVER